VILAAKETGDEKDYGDLDIDRRSMIPAWLEKFTGERLAFSLNNAWAKYYRRDSKPAPS